MPAAVCTQMKKRLTVSAVQDPRHGDARLLLRAQAAGHQTSEEVERQGEEEQQEGGSWFAPPYPLVS